MKYTKNNMMKLRPITYRFAMLLCAFAAACTLSTALARPQASGTPEQLVRSIYTLPDPDFGAFLNPERRPLYYSSQIVWKAAKAEQCYFQKYTMSELEFDYITIGGDYDTSNLAITTQEENDDYAKIAVRFGADAFFTELFYHLIATPDGWRIDDVTTQKNGSLSEMLENECWRTGDNAGGIRFLQPAPVALEELDLVLAHDRIRARFLFRNESDADITVPLAFVLPDIAPEDLIKREDTSLTRQLDFTMEVNNRKLMPRYDVRAVLEGKDITDELKDLGIAPDDVTARLSELSPAQRAGLKEADALHPMRADTPNWHTQLALHWEQDFPPRAQAEIYLGYVPFLGNENIDPKTITDVPAFTESLCMTDAQKAQAAELLQRPGARVYDLEYDLPTRAERVAITIEKRAQSDMIATCLPGLEAQGPNTYGVSNPDIEPEDTIRVLFIHKE